MKKITFLLFCTTSLYAEESKGTFSYMGEFVNMIVTLLFVLTLAFVSVLFLKKFMRSKMRQLNQATGIKVLERRALNSKSSLYLVDILGKGVVISESQAGGIQLITEFPQGTDIELLLAEEQQERVPKKEITAALQKKLASFFKRSGQT